MTIIKIVILIFIVLETSNVLMLYFAPGSKNANAVGVFTAWEKSKQYPEIHNFIKYLVYWVAGAKLIFLLLLTVIIIFADIDFSSFGIGKTTYPFQVFIPPFAFIFFVLGFY